MLEKEAQGEQTPSCELNAHFTLPAHPLPQVHVLAVFVLEEEVLPLTLPAPPPLPQVHVLAVVLEEEVLPVTLGLLLGRVVVFIVHQLLHLGTDEALLKLRSRYGVGIQERRRVFLSYRREEVTSSCPVAHSLTGC